MRSGAFSRIRPVRSPALATIAGLVAAVALAACASSRQIGDQVVELNKGLENGHNALLLLNVVRAYQQRPMHFMRLSALRGAALPTSTTFGLAVPIGPDAASVYPLTGSVNTARPTFETQILDNQEFVRGITTPVPTATMLYYLDQGWPQQMVLMMFVRNVDVLTRREGQDVLTARLSNNPQNQAEFEAFQQFIAELRGCNIEVDARSDRAPYGPVYPAAALSDVRTLVAAKGAQLLLAGTDARGEPVGDPVPTHYRFFEVRDRSFLKLTDKPGREGPCRAADRGAVFAARAADAPPAAIAEGSSAKPGERTIVLGMRSPEAMIYYLGEIARAQLDGRYDRSSGRFRAPTDADRIRVAYNAPHGPADEVEREVRMFSITRGQTASRIGAQVDFEGETYSVPAASREDRSMHVLSLVSQILMLQNRGAELPSTTSVRIVP